MRRIEKVLLVLGILSLVVLALPDLGMLAAMTIIGLPLAIAYWAIPAIFLVTLVAYIIHRVLPLSGKLAVTASVVLAVAALALPPFVLNSAIHRQAASFAAGDLNKLSLPLTAHSIASREKFRFRKGATKCDGFCLHSLLTGTAKRFLVAHSDTPYSEVSPDQDAIAFQLERRQDCPPVSFKSGAHTLSFRRVNASTVRAADPVETLKLRISNGECLVSAPAKLGDADLVVSRGKVSTGVSRYAGTGFSLNLDTIAASRISVHEKKDGTSFGETFRQTQVQYRPFGWFMLPAPDSRGNYKVGFGWWRSAATINVENRYRNPSEWTEFLEGKLGFKLRLAGEETKKKTLDKLRKLLDEETPPSAADWALLAQYFDRLGLGRSARVDANDFKLAVRMLNNKDYPAPPSLHKLVNYAARSASEPELAALAGILVNRLSDASERYEGLGAKPAQQIKHLALGVRALPGKALLPHKEAMMALASRLDVQRHGYIALQRLAVFGDEAVPTLLTLMKAGLDGGEHFYRKPQFQHPYLGGLRGLCMAGANATTALQHLRQLTAAGKLPDHASYGRLLFTTLLRVGEDKEQVRSLFMAAERNKANATDKHFDRLVAGALKKKRMCYF